MLHYTYVLIDPRDSSVFYVGKGFGRRMFDHKKHSIRGAHRNLYVQRKILKILGLGLQVVPEKIFEHEDEWPCHIVEMLAICFYDRDNLCNLSDGGEGGFNPSEETRAKISAKNTGRKASEEVRRKMSAARSGEKHPGFGKKRSPEIIARVSESLKGRRLSAEHVAKLHSPEVRTKISASKLGKKLSQEHRAKLSAKFSGEKNHFFGKKHSQKTIEKLLGHVVSQETRMKIAAAQTGKKASPETRARMSVAATGRRCSPESVAKRWVTRRARRAAMMTAG
jgi:hypothetical protein